MSPLVAIAFLVGVNKGGTSGGAIPSILLNALAIGTLALSSVIELIFQMRRAGISAHTALSPLVDPVLNRLYALVA